MLVIVIVAAAVAIAVCFADWSRKPAKPPRGYCCWDLWDYGTCTCPDRERNIGR